MDRGKLEVCHKVSANYISNTFPFTKADLDFWDQVLFFIVLWQIWLRVVVRCQHGCAEHRPLLWHRGTVVSSLWAKVRPNDMQRERISPAGQPSQLIPILMLQLLCDLEHDMMCATMSIRLKIINSSTWLRKWLCRVVKYWTQAFLCKPKLSSVKVQGTSTQLGTDGGL